MQKIFLFLGLLFILIAALFPLIKKLPFGRLPGDIFIQSEKSIFIFPVITCLIISIILTVIFNLFR